MYGLYQNFVYEPMYNGLVALMSLLPWADAGLIVIAFTILVKLILFPLSKKAVATQLAMKKFDPELRALKEKYKDNREEQARAMMKFYKEKNINPFSSIVLIFIQLPVVIALYSIFFKGGLPMINTDILYSFISPPASVNMVFLNLVDISTKSIVLALAAGVTTFFQIRYSSPKLKPRVAGEEVSFHDDLARSMNMQMRYVFPVFAAFISYHISAAIALYWITSNFFTIGQELVIRRRYSNGK